MTSSIPSQEMGQLIETVAARFLEVPLQHLNRKPSDLGWTAGQCLRHIQLNNESYFPGFEKVLSAQYQPAFWEKHSPFTAAIGRSMIEQLGFPVKKKFKAPRLFQPGNKQVGDSFIVEFIEHLKKVQTIFEQIEHAQVGKRVLRSPVSNLITIHASDVCETLKVHTRRHVEQAIRALEA